MNADPKRWKSVPGGLDPLNLFYIPPVDDLGYPLIKDDVVIVPDELIPFRSKKELNDLRTVHFFIDDYRFECVWNRPQVYAKKYAGKQVLAPDFSIFINYPVMIQKWNIYRNRWIGAYFQRVGIKVIPTIVWSDEQSFDYCFAGIEPKTAVAISPRGVVRYKKEFSLGVDAMVEHIDPQLIICAGDFAKVYVGKNQLDNVVSYSLEPRYCYKRVR